MVRSEDLPAADREGLALHRARLGPRTEVLVARLADGEVVAFATRCPHQRTPLEDATLWEGHLRCPRHLYLYDLRTGENVLPARGANPDTLWKLRPGYLPTFRVEERDGWIWVAEAPDPPPASYDPERERPPRHPGVPAEPGPAPVSAGPGPGSAGPGAAAPEPPLEHPVERLRALVGERLEVVLPTAPRPGHFWRLEVAPALLEVGDQRFEPAPPPRLRATLRARAAGRATLRCTYATPWDATPKEVRSFVIDVDEP